jgi:muramoyltetrapeptide carboxypeptidase
VNACKLPPFLTKGSRVKLIATARFVEPSEIAFGIDYLKKSGFEVLLSEHLYKKHHAFAGNDEIRLAELQSALDDESIEAIFCVRGGFGTLQLIDKIDFTKFLKNPKWVIGYSDITVLHAVINYLGVCTMHATMPINFEKHLPSTQTLIDYLKGIITPIKWETNNASTIKTKGILCGGNLSLLFALQGSKTIFAPKNAIVFVEDLDEYYYHIDRMVLSLSRSVYFTKSNTRLVGGFDGIKDHVVSFGQNEIEIIQQYVNKSAQIVDNFPAGHGEINMPLIMGTLYEIEIKNKRGTASPLFN